MPEKTKVTSLKINHPFIKFPFTIGNRISDSYRWENTRQGFTHRVWVNVLLDFLYHQMSTTDIEQKYIHTANSVKSSNLMYSNVVLRRFFIEKRQTNFDILQMNEVEAKTNIIEWIKTVVNAEYKTASEINKKEIDQWLLSQK